MGRVCDAPGCGNHVEMTVVRECEKCGDDYCVACMMEHECERRDRYGAECLKDSERTNPRGL
jgi:hypothetical protein